jgi:SpoVK/Ycf46/Vps4 family AAA+-type ATPase
LHLLTTAQEYKPQFSAEFPATRLETSLTWDDLVLNHDTQVSILEVRAWLRQYKKIMEHPIFGREAHGYKCLLHGEPGTGKTLTVKLLGKEIGADIYRIDLSKIVSKYIGETEKNLHKIFEMAKYQDWVLFFDEGDALFGKRSEAKSSNDRYANQETAFLLQKMEEHQGILILATNIRTNLDKAFLRRFQSDIYFGLPDENARLQLWEKAFAQYLQLEEGIDLHETSRKFSFTGANIHNIRQQCAVLAFDRGNNIVTKDDFQEAIKKQLQKDGKTM